MQGCNGISPIITFSMWITFVTPRVLHGIKMLDVRQKDLQSLEKFQRKCLKQLQGLPTSTASAAVYYLLGAYPVEGLIDQRFLSTFGNILQNITFIEFRLAKRQLLHKDENSNSWFMKILEILTKYNLPNPLELLENPPKKEHWKRTYKKKMKDFWSKKQTDEIAEMSSLKFLGTTASTPGKPHLVWATTKDNPMETEKAMVKVKLMTGTYRLQAERSKLSRGQQSPICNLCRTSEEDASHLLLHCSALQHKRDPYLRQMEEVMAKHLSPEAITTIADSDDLKTQLFIDCTHPSIIELAGCRKEWLEDAERTSRRMVYALHRLRATKLRDVFK